MSAGPEQTVVDVVAIVAVACVVESSLLLASEWSRVLIDYVYPLLKRLNELHPSHQFRLAFVTYGAADTRPMPLLSKRFFAPLSQVTKELREEPSKLGIGQTNSGSGRGLSALEGLVAAIELFDILMSSANLSPINPQTQSPQKENRSLISHLLHIAASPPDNAQRPHCNTLQHLDSVNWDSIPAELRKRKINLSLICLRKIPQFQDLQSSVAGPGAQSPWFTVRSPHILWLAGFPNPQKTGAKRQTDALLPNQSPDPKRHKVIADSTSKQSPASPALSSARTPQNQRSQQPLSSQVPQTQPTAISAQNSSSAQPVQAVPTYTPVAAVPLPHPPPSVPVTNNQVFEQVVAPTGLKFGQMMKRLKALDVEIALMDSQISNAQNNGQTAILAGLQKDRASKIHLKEQIRALFKQHYQKMLLAKDALNAEPGAFRSALPNAPAEAGSSTQSHPPSASSAWYGTFSYTSPQFSMQSTNETQMHVIGMIAPPAQSDVRVDVWPKNFILKACKEPLKDNQELLSWLMRNQFRSHAMQFKPNPHVPDGPVNEQRFQALNKFMTESRIYAYAGCQMPSGKFSYNIFVFPMGANFAGAMFPDGLPDLPGNGNVMDGRSLAEETKIQPFSGLNLPPALIARMQSLEPARQKQVIAHFIRAQQQEQLLRQQLQQSQQHHTASNQPANSLGLSIPPNPYGAAANIPGLQANVNLPTNVETHNTGTGTVNYEMLQSFMQRSAEGSQGMNPG